MWRSLLPQQTKTQACRCVLQQRQGLSTGLASSVSSRVQVCVPQVEPGKLNDDERLVRISELALERISELALEKISGLALVRISELALERISELALEIWAQAALVSYKTLNSTQPHIFRVRSAAALSAALRAATLEGCFALRSAAGWQACHPAGQSTNTRSLACAPTGAGKATSTHASHNQHVQTGFTANRQPVCLCHHKQPRQPQTKPTRMQPGFTTMNDLVWLCHKATLLVCRPASRLP